MNGRNVALIYLVDLLVGVERGLVMHTDSQALWEKQFPMIEDLPSSIVLAFGRAYRRGQIKKPLAELTDDEILSIRHIGTGRLAAIREIIPKPCEEP